MRRKTWAVGTIFAALTGPPLAAQPPCGVAGPDMVVGDINSIANLASAGTPLDGTDALTIGVIVCNNGDAAMLWNGVTNRHPAFGSGLFRLSTVDGVMRFEQVGQSWVRHEFSPLQQAFCCTCIPPGAPPQPMLGAGCSTTTTAGISASSTSN